MSDQKVVSLRGSAVVAAGIPNEGLVAALERWLEQARSGELQGASIVALHSDETTSYQNTGSINRALVGAATINLADMVDFIRWVDVDEEEY